MTRSTGGTRDRRGRRAWRLPLGGRLGLLRLCLHVSCILSCFPFCSRTLCFLLGNVISCLFGLLHALSALCGGCCPIAELPWRPIEADNVAGVGRPESG